MFGFIPTRYTYNDYCYNSIRHVFKILKRFVKVAIMIFPSAHQIANDKVDYSLLYIYALQ